MSIEELKQDLLERYNNTWQEAHVTDNLGVIQGCKDNFKELLEILMDKCFISGLNSITN